MSNKNKGRLQRLTEALWGVPKKVFTMEKGRTAVLGTVEQSIGMYQIPSFMEMDKVYQNDPLIKEAITMFAEQVCATGIYLTCNPKYTLKLNGKTALEVIEEWRDYNNLDIKLLEIAIELKAFGNSFWRITDNGFVKIPVESVWRMSPIESDIALQEKYNLQLVPLYRAKIINWEEFMHFRVGVTGYKAPLGKGVLYSLLARPIDRYGNVCPSIYDIRLSMRASLDEGFRKFSFGNELWCFPNMSNEDFKAPMDNGKTLGENIAGMSNTGNRIATNTEGSIELAVPERTQSYDQFIKQMRDEFFMALADPSLKLGLEEGFTKATSVTASDIYKFKIATMRRQIKEHFEDLFEQILDKLGYDGKLAAVKMNFGPEESATYEVKEVIELVKNRIMTPNEARALLAKYRKFDITGDIKNGDEPLEIKPSTPFGNPVSKQTKEDKEKLKESKKKLREAKLEEQRLSTESIQKGNELKDKRIQVLNKILSKEEDD